MPVPKKFPAEELREILPFSEDASVRLLASSDQGEVPAWLSRTFAGRPPDAVAWPEDGSASQRLLDLCARKEISVVPRGAGSFALGGALPARGGIVCDLSRMRKILEVNSGASTVTVEAGVRWFDLSETLKSYGLSVLSHPTSIFSTVGGWVATGGCGVGTIQNGPLSNQVASLQVIYPTGETKVLGRDDPEFPLLFGSEGQLGLISGITLKVRKCTGEFPYACTFEDEEEALAWLSGLCRSGPIPFYAAVYSKEKVHKKNAFLGQPFLPEKCTALLVFDELSHRDSVKSLPGALPISRATYLWGQSFLPLRGKKLGLLGAEMVLPVSAIPGYMEAGRKLAALAGASISTEIQLTEPDRAIVITSFPYDNRTEERRWVASIFSMALTAEALRRKGVPYGLGVWLSGLASLKFPPPGLAKLKDLKARVDPKGILNPGKFLAPPSGMVWLSRLGRTGSKLVLGLLGDLSVPEETQSPGTWETALSSCSKCGNCIPRCPAYLAVGDERVTARGKLLLATALRDGSLAPPEAQTLFLCMHCKLCTEVCQSDIPLETVFFELEEKVASLYGRPEERINEFLKRVKDLHLMENLPISKEAS
ncbi:MAG: FAD-binding protein [Armatimonadetes bacterium]|nr:FAD-binding protein [Armatimonadota bacterium]